MKKWMSLTALLIAATSLMACVPLHHEHHRNHHDRTMQHERHRDWERHRAFERDIYDHRMRQEQQRRDWERYHMHQRNKMRHQKQITPKQQRMPTQTQQGHGIFYRR